MFLVHLRYLKTKVQDYKIAIVGVIFLATDFRTLFAANFIIDFQLLIQFS